MDNKPQAGLVSIVLPTHNRKHLLPRAIDSVLRQSYKQWELIVVDDNSTDGTSEVMTHYISDSRVRYIPLKDNMGGAVARNIAIKKTTGEFVAFLDDDDEWLPDKLRVQVKLLRERDDVAVVSCNYEKRMGNLQRQIIASNPVVQLDDLLFKNDLKSFSFCMTKANYLSETEIEPILKAAQDWDLWFKILQNTGKNGIVAKNILVNYYVHDGPQISSDEMSVFRATLRFVHANWRYMNNQQKCFHLACLFSQKNKLNTVNWRQKFQLSWKSARYLWGSKSHFNLYYIVLLVIVPLLSRHKPFLKSWFFRFSKY